MIIKYGIDNYTIDVTQICYDKFLYGNMIVIPPGDHIRCIYFTDPTQNVLKHVYVTDEYKTYKYDYETTVFIDISENKVTATSPNIGLIGSKLFYIHQNLKIKHGSLMEELNEQGMAIRFLTGNEKILEIGGNIGRNSLVIASILGKENDSNLVVLESDPNTAVQLAENRDMNNMNFHIEPSALSKRKLIQNGWQTIESEEVLDGFFQVNTITYQELTDKYNIKFDTLILDCEGAFYFILQDMPEVLENVQSIIAENDYLDVAHKKYVDDVLKEKGFYLYYIESGTGCGATAPCANNFYEYWKRNSTA